LNEHTLLNNPDCSGGNCAAPVFKRKPLEIIRHEKFDSDDPTSQYDIALIRVNEMMPLHYEVVWRQLWNSILFQEKLYRI